MSKNIVYSTDPDWQAESQTITEANAKAKLEGQTAYIERDRKKRAGKTVTVVSNLKGDLKSLQKELQKHCGSGGALKNNTIEIQGDHREKIGALLQKKDCIVKYKGG